MVLEGRCEKARAGPGGLLPCSEDVVAALYRQGTAVLDECVPCDLLGGERVDIFKPVCVVLSEVPSCSNFKCSYCCFMFGNISDEVGIFVSLLFMSEGNVIFECDC